MGVGVPGLAGVCSAIAVVAMGTWSASASPASVDATAVPSELAGYSHLTGSVSDSAPGRAVALYQHGFGVEFLDFPQAVVLGADGRTYRRVDVAEGRAGPETQGDPAPMLLSPDGTRIAVGDHDIDDPDVVVVDLLTGDTSRHRLPEGRSVVPVAWSPDGRQLAHLLSPAPTNPYRGEPIVGDVGVLDLKTGETTMLRRAREVRTAAFSPDGTQLAVQQDVAGGEQLSVVDIASDTTRVLEADGELAGPASWSPDGRLLATTTVRSLGAVPGIRTPTAPTGLAFVDTTGRGGDVPAPLELPLAPDGRVLGWRSPDQALVLTVVQPVDDGRGEGPDAYELSVVSLGHDESTALMRIPELQDFGVSRFQLADANVDELEVVTPADVDRGPLPLPVRGGAAALTGLVVWGLTRRVERRVACSR
jgi:dipeptidyl aminopeptidase/acylaminoacyl peptidase